MSRGQGTPAGSNAVRPAAVAGQFYPGDPRVLASEIRGLFERCSADIPGGVPVALISPHAGYLYSGLTAAEGYYAVRSGKFDVVVIVSPSHREYFEGITVYPGRSYSTPLGELPVDDGLRRALTEGDGMITISDAGHRGEHAVEVQLPFIATLFGKIPILPVVMGDQRRPLCHHLGRRLPETLAGRKALIVASTDLSHYHPYSEAERIDGRFIELLGKFDYRGIMDGLEAETVEACGGGPAVAVLMAASAIGADNVSIRHHCNSGDTGGDPSAVVGYVSAVATAP